MKVAFTPLPKKERSVFDYQFYKTKLGTLLIASWQDKVTYVAFAPSQKEALAEARTRFPKRDFQKKESPAQKQILRYLEAPQKFTETLTVATEGSAFQLHVWQALTKVPFGKTCFYSDLAKAIKKPSAVRAAASAVAKNPLAIIVPCHRVLPRSGGVGNYHWGSKNKSSLLSWEGFTLAA